MQRSLAIHNYSGYGKANASRHEAFDDHIGARWRADGNKATRRLPQFVATRNDDGLVDGDALISAFIETDDLAVGAGGRDRVSHKGARRRETACAAAAVVSEEGSLSGTGGRCGGCKGKGADSAHDGDDSML